MRGKRGGGLGLRGLSSGLCGGLADLDEAEDAVLVHADDLLVRGRRDLLEPDPAGHVQVPPAVRVTEAAEVAPPAVDDVEDGQREAVLNLGRLALALEVHEEAIPVALLKEVEVNEVEAGGRQIIDQLAERERAALCVLVAEHEPTRVRERVAVAVGPAETERVAADLLGLLDVPRLHRLRLLRAAVVRPDPERLQGIDSGLQHEVQRDRLGVIQQRPHCRTSMKMVPFGTKLAHFWATTQIT